MIRPPHGVGQVLASRDMSPAGLTYLQDWRKDRTAGTRRSKDG